MITTKTAGMAIRTYIAYVVAGMALNKQGPAVTAKCRRPGIVRFFVDNLLENLLGFANVTMPIVRCCKCNSKPNKLSTMPVSFNSLQNIEL